MTTIAYRDGVMAADSGARNSGACIPWAQKLARGHDGTLYGVSGSAAESTMFLEWVRDGVHTGKEQPKPRPTGECQSSFIVLVAPVIGPLRLITAYGDESYYAPYFAIGAGAATALGALYAGASAEGAIYAALCHADGASGTVNIITHAAEKTCDP